MGRKLSYEEKIAEHVAHIVEKQQIELVVHFTRLENLPGIMKHGLLSRSLLQHADYELHFSDPHRLDGEDNAVSVSISYYNWTMFDAKRYRSGNKPWVILGLHPSLLRNYHCLFYRGNVAARERQYERGVRYGGFALEKLFEDWPIASDKNSFRAEYGLPTSCPTFPDAEVQVMHPIHPDYVLGAWVESAEHGEEVRKIFEVFGRTECEVLVQSFEPRICRKPYFWG